MVTALINPPKESFTCPTRTPSTLMACSGRSTSKRPTRTTSYAKSPALALVTPLGGAEWNRTIRFKEGTGSDEQGTAVAGGPPLHLLRRGEGRPRRLRQDRERRQEMTAPAIEPTVVRLGDFQAAFEQLLTAFGVTPNFATDDTAKCAPAVLALTVAAFGAPTVEMPVSTEEIFQRLQRQVGARPVEDAQILPFPSAVAS